MVELNSIHPLLSVELNDIQPLVRPWPSSSGLDSILSRPRSRVDGYGHDIVSVHVWLLVLAFPCLTASD
jgi:hypothetical protein